LRSTDLLILFGIRKNCHSGGRNLLLYLFMKKGDKSDNSNYRGISLLPTAYNILSSILLYGLTLYMDKIIGHHCGFDIAQLIRYWEKYRIIIGQYITYL
jgi:hypothetical protein